MDTPRKESRLERVGEVAVLRIANAARMNPLTFTLQQELRAHCAALREDSGVRALLITGEGKAFCVGADLSAMSQRPADGRSLGQWTADSMHALTNPLLLEIRALPFPVVVALNGAAAGAGVGLALAGDITVAARSAYYLMPFLPRLGIAPDMGSSWFLARRIGLARATGLALLGDRLGGQQAADWGLVWACVEDEALFEHCLGLARRLAAGPAHAAAEARALFDAAVAQPLPAQLALEAERQRELIDGPAFAEGVRAFAERRDPVFTPRG
jgi:2-(1,2-epoxy-1,2-dihydrophenyl)acetyl-CoA isomerase